MRQRLLTILAFLPFAAVAQTVANFETPALPKVDTFFMQYSVPTKDIGFNNGLAHFPLYTDTSFGGYWVSGFTYSSKTDSVSGGYGNQYSARAGKGYNSSNQYAVAYGEINKVLLTGAAIGKSVKGFYLTNNSYAYYDMKVGSPFSRKFGDTTGTKSGLPQGAYPDFFKVVIRGYNSGVLKPDTVEAYLADYRSPDSTKDYILKDWRWVSLLKLGGVDSLQFRLYSSDTSSFGINTPLYFCMDDFTTNESVGVNGTAGAFAATVYPNPAAQTLTVEMIAGSEVQEILLFDMSGRMVLAKRVLGEKEELNLGDLPSGNYLLQLRNAAGQTASQRTTKQ